jgi:gamma-glutamyltranspeptidase/glutathione hydrolase
MREGGGLLGEDDLAAYTVIEREPLTAPYRGALLLTNPAPSFGGPLLALSLRLLETAEVGARPLGCGAHLATLGAVMQEVDRRRDQGCLEPDALGDALLEESAARIRTASGGTTHISVCDADGNAASMTTSNGEGSGHFVSRTGIMLNNMLGEDDLQPGDLDTAPPSARVASGMSPSMLLRDGALSLVLGSGGSKRIRSALLQVLSAVVDFGLDVRAAVETPRLHWDGECLQIEPGFTPDALAALAARFATHVWDVPDLYFGGVHALAPDGEAAADPRRGGWAATL